MVAFVPPSGDEKPLGPWTNRNVRKTQWTPNKPKARRLRPTYRLTSVSVNMPSNSSPTQSQTKIVGTLKPNAVFSILVLTSSLSKLFIAVRPPNPVHQHWGDKETPKCPNHFDWDCSCIPLWLFTDLHSVLSRRTSYVHRFDSEVLSIWNLTYHVLVRNDYYYHYHYYYHPR